MLRVNSIYPAFMGEVNPFGIGVPCTFVRLAGCNLRCYLSTKGILCDTPEALLEISGDMMSEEAILDRCHDNGYDVICLTGGEPLLQNITDFLHKATSHGFSVVIETNGSRPISPYIGISGVSFIVDRKGKSSGEHAKMCEDNYSLMGESDFLKFVIDTEEDYYEALDFYRSRYHSYNVAFGLFWGSQVTYQWLMKRMHADKVRAYLNMQTHKMACLYDESKEKELFTGIKVPRNL